MTRSKNSGPGLLHVLTSSLKIPLVVGLFIGVFEALYTASKVLLHNSFEYWIFIELITLVCIGILIYVLLQLVANLFLVPIVHFPIRKLSQQLVEFNFERWLWRLNYIFGIFFTLGCWINFILRHSKLTDKIIYSILVLISSVVISEIATRISSTRHTKLNPTKKGILQLLLVSWFAIIIMALVPNVGSDSRMTESKPNVILLIIDTLRADRLGSYGYGKNTTASIDKIAEQGVVFENAYVPWSKSLPSHASIMTSMYPQSHGAFPNGEYLDPKLQTLAKILKKHGYKTGAFVTNELVGNQYNFDLGFDTFIDFAELDYENTSLGMWVRMFNLIKLLDYVSYNDIYTQLALIWLDKNKNKNRPFFLWMQWLHPHTPYQPQKKFLERFENNYSGIADGSKQQIQLIIHKKLRLSKEDQEHYEALYDAEVAYSDYQVGRVIDKLKSLDLLENSLLIITSDHGENLYEHGLEYQHSGVYDSSVRIPVIFHLPGKLPKNKRIIEVIESIDILPTTLDILEIPLPVQFQGKSALSLIHGKKPNWNSVAHIISLERKQSSIAIRSGDWKIISTIKENQETYELYHIPSDPNEVVNRIETELEIADSLKQALTDWIQNDFEEPSLVYNPGEVYKKKSGSFDKETLDRLKSMGYIK